MKIEEIVSDLPVPPGDPTAFLLYLRLCLRYLADHMNHVEVRGRYVHDGHDAAEVLNDVADELRKEFRSVGKTG